MKVTPFDARRDLIVATARLWGPVGWSHLSLAVDTGSSETVITPEAADDLGYSPRDGETITTVRSAIGKEQGYTLRVTRFSALGFAIPDYLVHVFELATGPDIDGLIGLSFLRHFNVEIRFRDGEIRVEPIAHS